MYFNCKIVKTPAYKLTNVKGARKSEEKNNIDLEEGTYTKKIDPKNIADNYKNKAKDIADKIKQLTEELRNLKLSKNSTKEEIAEFINKINAMKTQVNALYDEMESFHYRTKCKEYDEFYQAFRDFNDLTLKKTTEAQRQMDTLNGWIVRSRVLNPYTKK